MHVSHRSTGQTQHLGLLLGGALILASACGGTSPAAVTPPEGTVTPAHSAAAKTADSAAVAAPAPKNHSAVGVRASTMLDKIKELGVDLNMELAKVPMGKKKKLMPLFQEALGFDSCEGCHVEGDYKKETKNIKLARGMWDHYVKDLRMADNSPLFCDSCHDGNEHLIPRHDKDAVQTMMTDEYETKLARADGEEHSCSTCHTDVFEVKVFADVWGIK